MAAGALRLRLRHRPRPWHPAAADRQRRGKGEDILCLARGSEEEIFDLEDSPKNKKKKERIEDIILKDIEEKGNG